MAPAAKSQGSGERPPYEQARDELTELVRRLEAGGLTLAQSLQLWERGEELAAICEDWLEGARARLAGAIAKHDDARDPQSRGGQSEPESQDGRAQGAPF